MFEVLGKLPYHIFTTKNIGKFKLVNVSLTFEIFKEKLTNDVVSFEQPGPEIQGPEKKLHVVVSSKPI